MPPLKLALVGDAPYAHEYIRRVRDTADPRIVVHELPDDVAQRCLDIATVLELRWTGIDFRLTPEGRYVFLEANPSPMFRGFESRCGLPLTESLAALLTE